MSNTQFKINFLKELNSKLLVEISELRKKYSEIKAENVKLKQAFYIRTEKKEKSIFMEQYPINSNDTLASNISDNTSNSSITSDPMPELVQSSTEPESSAIYLSQDVTDDDLTETLYKEQVSNKIMERIREKKLQDQKVSSGKQNTSSGELEELMIPPLSCDMKTVNTIHDQEKTSPKEFIQNIS
ncbi:11963_t:CDS:2 [Ambispora gerdemannii]|uniref:11963_t:CDS:1 n=1 Tax=Ambispora gerdemannii TaxID=144530 RepID=A0A9N9D8K3_9GLOM|nr:11963_t:CDS:2 [Ambispora gerdemannii]